MKALLVTAPDGLRPQPVRRLPVPGPAGLPGHIPAPRRVGGHLAHATIAAQE